MLRKHSLLLSLFFYVSLYSQNIKIDKIEPPNWWAGMSRNEIQLMVYGENLNDLKVRFDGSEMKVLEVHEVESALTGTYAFVDIEIPEGTIPSDYRLIFENSHSETEVTYAILPREKGSKDRLGFTPDDVIYLLMPDRFANGDISNDIVEGYGKDLDRSKGIARHGGDIQGIINHLDYIKEAGFTAIWLNPVVENNSEVSYHGYGATNFYKVDPRLGTNELYKTLVDEAHKRGIKIILDHVANHIHINHSWMKNLPVKGWINGSSDNYFTTNHDKIASFDVHGSKSTMEKNTRGWFTGYMPDLNQSNPFMANYIIQNTIWWMEYAAIDGIREDTYPYADPVFMVEWAKVILEEYPSTNIVGEVWKGEPAFLATYQEKSIFTPGFNTHLPSLTDFGLADALRAYLNGSKNISHIYEIIGMDYLYHDPYNLVTFIDNHDVERVMFSAKENINKVKTALQILLTTRGIPQILYATEIAAVGDADHGALRIDFPGGFPGDTRDAFTADGRTEKENDMYNLIKSLINIRKENKAISQGKLIHFPPADNVYIYFRILGEEKVMIVVNDNPSVKNVDLSLAKEILENAPALKDLKSGKEIKLDGPSVNVPGQDVNIYKIL